MNCALCQSGNQAEFAAEMMLHLSGRKYLDNPGVLVFPRVSVCMDCGFSRFTITDADLQLLGKSSAAAAA
jgi:hypothetical protein